MEKYKHLWRVKMPGQKCWVYYRAADLAELEKEVTEWQKDNTDFKYSNIKKVELVAAYHDLNF